MRGKHFWAVLALLALLSPALAQPNVIITVLPDNPNITTFGAGYHEIYVGSLDWEGYSSVTISTDDFEITGGGHTIALDAPFVSFGISGDSGGTKEYSLTFSGGGPEFTANESLYVDPEPPQEGGPVVLSDFDFSKTYDSAQEIKFDCFGSLEYPTECEPDAEYRINGGKWKQFEFASPIKFRFDGTKTIEIRATNEIGLSSITTFTLTINLPDSEPDPGNNPGGGTPSGGTYVPQDPAETGEPTEDNDQNAEQEQDLGEENETGPDGEEKTDFKEDTHNNNNGTAIAEKGVSKNTAEAAPATQDSSCFRFLKRAFPGRTQPE